MRINREQKSVDQWMSKMSTETAAIIGTTKNKTVVKRNRIFKAQLHKVPYGSCDGAMKTVVSMDDPEFRSLDNGFFLDKQVFIK